MQDAEDGSGEKKKGALLYAARPHGQVTGGKDTVQKLAPQHGEAPLQKEVLPQL